MPSITDCTDPTPKLPSFYLSVSQVRESGLLSAARMAELDAEIDRRISCPLDNEGMAIVSHRLADLSPYGRYLYPFMPHEEVPFEYARRQVLAAILTDEERNLLSRHASGIASEKREAERFTKAKHLLEEDWTGWVTDGDSYWEDTDAFRDQWEREHDFTPYDEPVEDEDRWIAEVPQYLWAARPKRVIPELDVADLVGHIIDDRGWEEMSIDDLNGVEAFQSALDAFVKANEPVMSYELDYTTAILLTREVKA